MTDSTPGWQADPTGRHEHRYWDGSQWTDNVSDAGVASTDAYAGGDDATAVAGSTDPTLAQPTAPADPTAAFPAAPPPPLPQSDAGSPVAPDSGGSKRGLLVGGGILAAVVVAIGAFLLLGGDDDSGDVEGRLASALRSEGSMSEEQADCMAGHIVDEIGAGRLADVDFDADEPPAELQGDLVDAYASGASECEVDITGGDSDEDDGGEDGDGTDLGDFELGEDSIADIYEEMGLDREKAECLAGRMTEAIESGEIAQDEAMTDIFGYLEDCDISMSELGAAN